MYSKLYNIFCGLYDSYQNLWEFHHIFSHTVERLRLRLQICLSLTPVSICLNFSQLNCLLRIISSTAIKNVRTYTWHRSKIDKSEILALGVTLDHYKLLCHTFIIYFISDECITWQFKNIFSYFQALNVCFNYFRLLYLSFYEINKQREIETNWDMHEIQTNP